MTNRIKDKLKIAGLILLTSNMLMANDSNFGPTKSFGPSGNFGKSTSHKEVKNKLDNKGIEKILEDMERDNVGKDMTIDKSTLESLNDFLKKNNINVIESLKGLKDELNSMLEE